MTRNEVILALMRANLFQGHWTLDDNSYDAMSQEFIVAAWQVWVASLPDELKEPVELGGGKHIVCPKWIFEVFDCDNIAQDFLTFLDRCMAVDAVKMNKPRGNAGAGRFNFWLNADPAKGHCRCWFIDYEGVAHVFDAGNCQLDGQSKAESATTFYGESV